MNWANSAPITKVATPGGNDPLVLERYQSVRLLYAIPRHDQVRYLEPEKLDSPLISMLNTGYLMTWTTRTIDHPSWTYVEDLPGHRLYRNPRVLPRFWMPAAVQGAASKEEALRLLAEPGFDPAKTAIIEATPLPVAAGGSARVLAYAPQEVTLTVDAPADSFLASSEAFYPGWIAEVDGRAAPVLMTNGAFRGVAIPKGRHEVRFSFQPNLYTGLAITIAAGLFILWRAAPAILRRVRSLRPAR